MNTNHPDYRETNPEELVEEMEAQYDGEQPDIVSFEHAAKEVKRNSNETISQLEEQVSEHKKRELQAQAELENFRKRMIRDSEQSLRYASVPLVRDLLEILDNMSRAIDAAKQLSESTKSENPLLNGVTMVYQQFANVLAKYNCVVIEALGKEFDPNYHEAISQAPSDQYPAGTVMLEATKGYRIYDRVIRPSQVIVSTGPAA